MAYEIIISLRAKADLAAIESTIAQDDPVAARRHGDELVARMESLAQFPFQGSRLQWRRSLRKIIHGSYLIVYRVRESSEKIDVYRVWHAARDPTSFRLRETAAPYPSTVTQASP